ncbi:MAG TPA: efflux RND transporter periplasmic adaptor subunit [Thermodesulfobacteriota bacterium]|nr:efflux RND transporter periplasmic adaptor subunit [Thermodesulfobacteriota bacterium]
MNSIRIGLGLLGTVFSLCKLHGFIFFFLLISLLYSCHGEKKEGSQASAVEVTVIKAEPKTVPVTIEYVGQTQSSHIVEIRARVEGYIDKIAYKEGSLVKKGDLLFQLDPRPFQAKVEEAKGELAAAKANLTRAKREYARIEPLYKQNAVSQRTRDNAEAALLEAEASVQSAKGKLMDAEVNLGYTTITSPVTGLSDFATQREGALVSPGPDSLLTTISVPDPMWVYFSVSENDLFKYRDQIIKGYLNFPPKDDFQVQLVLADGSIFPEKGRVTFAAPLFSQQTGTFLVRAVLANPPMPASPYGLLRPGQFVQVQLIGATRPNAIVVPQQAVVQTAKGHAVYVVKDGKAELRNVEVGEWQGADGWFITSGLKRGEEVVVTGTNKLREGAPVKIAQQSTAGAQGADPSSQAGQ